MCLIYAGLVACDSNDPAATALSPDSHYSNGPEQLELANDNTEMHSDKDNVILEGTLGPETKRPPLERSLVSGSTAPAGSESFTREPDQVSYESGAPSVDDAKLLSPESTDSLQNTFEQSEK